MEPWGTPALTKYYCEDFPSRATQSCLLQLNLYKMATLGTTQKLLLVVSDRWLSEKMPLQNDRRQNLVVLGRFLVFIPTVNVL